MKLQASNTLQVAGVALDGLTAQAATFTSDPFPLMRALGFAIIASHPSTGSPSGTYKVQVSNDISRSGSDIPAVGDLSVWVDCVCIDPTSTTFAAQAGTVSNAGTIGFCAPNQNCFFRYCRVVYTRVSGSITPTVRIQWKGVG
jgi:hypothetical protein